MKTKIQPGLAPGLIPVYRKPGDATPAGYIDTKDLVPEIEIPEFPEIPEPVDIEPLQREISTLKGRVTKLQNELKSAMELIEELYDDEPVEDVEEDEDDDEA